MEWTGLGVLTYASSMEPGLYDPSADNDPPK